VKAVTDHRTLPEIKSWDIVMIDIVGYSTLSEEGQFQAISRLTEVVKQTDVIGASGDRIFLPTGDGMAVGFHGRPARPLELASQIHLAYGPQRNKLKIGIHSGIAFEIPDINGNMNIAGSGINLAQRTLSCCRGGHILVAEDPGGKLKNSDRWRGVLHGPYRFQVKHDVLLTAYNYCENEVGNPDEDFNNLVSLPSYEPLKERLARMGATAKGVLATASLGPSLGTHVMIDDIILEAPILGFRGVDPAHTRVTMVTHEPALPDYVAQKKASIPEPHPNHGKVYLAHFISPLSDEANRLGLHIGYTDFWTSVAVESSIGRLHADIESGKLELFKLPRQLVCHVIVVTADQKLVLCRRSEDVRYEKLAWSASFEESIDAKEDLNADRVVDPVLTVRRALGVKEELGLPVELVDSAIIKFVAIGTEWSYLSAPLIVVVRLPSTQADQVEDYFLAAHDREHIDFDTILFTVPNCLELLRRGRHRPAERPSAEDRLHSTSKLRILCALFAEFGYGAILSQLV
jgi:hypothetical protein